MKRAFFSLLLLASMLGGASCRVEDVTTVTIKVPELKNAACADLVTGTLVTDQKIPRDQIKVDLAARTVTVTYDTMKRARKNLEIAIAEVGFSANEIPANPAAAAKLSPECRQ